MVKIGKFMSHEEAVIQLRSLYIPNPDMEYLLKLLSSVSQESKVSSNDNGVSQTVEARTGVALTTNVEVRPYVNLQPFRTFLEVPQPESMFLLRLDNDGKIALIEADGGVWKLEATRNIAAYFEDNLAELIGSIFSGILYFVTNRGGANLLHEYSQMNWAPYLLGLAVVGLEAGSMHAYKAGWPVSAFQVSSAAAIATILEFIGYLVYHEAITVNKLVGLALCLVGLFFLNK